MIRTEFQERLSSARKFHFEMQRRVEVNRPILFAEQRELRATVRDFQRVDIVLSRCSVDELAEIIDTANTLLSGLPLRWVAGVVSKELDRRERDGAEPGLLRLPVDRFSVPELCRFNQALRVWLRRETNPNIQDFLQQAFAIALGNLSSRFQILHEAYGQ